MPYSESDVITLLLLSIFRNLVLDGRMLSPLWQRSGAATTTKMSASPCTKASMMMVSSNAIYVELIVSFVSKLMFYRSA